MNEKEIKKNGLESLGRYYSVYRAEVVAVDDPLNLGRLKISCVQLYGTTSPAIWVFPRGIPAGKGHGIYWLPSIGDPILISCENGDPRFPLWEYGWFLKDQMPEGAEPGVYVFLTPGGQRLELNDNEGTITLVNSDGFKIKHSEDGLFLGKDDDDNLGKFLDDLFQLFSTTTVATPGGPAPFNNVAAYNDLRVRLSNFLKTSE